mmetsp:Transcript_15342/g.18669  ORF Transcript_15342/g.18669 Transcript_15342/m.18669 type:complete len:560 (+) Transcript_15342:132-1811(+)
MGRDKWRDKIDSARKLHRPSLKNWECDNLAARHNFPKYVADVTNRPENEASSLTPSLRQSHNYEEESIPRVVDANECSVSEFVETYERHSIPTVLKNIPTVENWAAVTKWEIDSLSENEDLRHRLMKCGEDDDENSIKIKLKHFIKYMRDNRDDSPLYIFDSSGFDNDRVISREILGDYSVPSYFKQDLFHLVGENRRPPYRWFLVGPERSGTTIHIDPLGTAAWNTLLVGMKRWVLFPPHIPKRVAKGRDFIGRNEDDEAIHYFMFILPRLKRHYTSGISTEFGPFECYEFNQYAGDTIYIPNGWWHAVINLTHTVGITQNYVSESNFDPAWCSARSGRKKMAYKLLCKLEEHYPHLAKRAKFLNRRDQFIMKYDPLEVEKREKEARKHAKRAKENERKKEKHEKNSNRDWNEKFGKKKHRNQSNCSENRNSGRKSVEDCDSSEMNSEYKQSQEKNDKLRKLLVYNSGNTNTELEPNQIDFGHCSFGKETFDESKSRNLETTQKDYDQSNKSGMCHSSVTKAYFPGGDKIERSAENIYENDVKNRRQRDLKRSRRVSP